MLEKMSGTTQVRRQSSQTFRIQKESRISMRSVNLSLQEGKDLYASWIVESCRHITHILEDLPNCKPSIDHVMELLPRLQARQEAYKPIKS